MKSKRIMSFLLVCALVFTLSVPTLAAGTGKKSSFIDVLSGKWYYDGVQYCVEHGLMSGITNELFAPEAPVTRAQLASLLYIMAGAPDTRGMSEPFIDVLSSSSSRKAIIWAYNSCIMQSASTHLFLPEGTVSRGQLVSILYLFAGSPAVSVDHSFKDDARIPSVYHKAAVWAYTSGIIDCDNGYFNSSLAVTRAQMAVIAERYCRSEQTSGQQIQTQQLRVATLNIAHCLNYKTGIIDYNAFASYLMSLDADIIALNEVRGKGLIPEYDAQVAILAEKMGYYFYFAKAIDLGGVASYGNAVLTRLKIKSCATIQIPKSGSSILNGDYEPRCLLKLTLTDPELTVLVSHFGISTSEQKSAVQTVLKNIPGGSCIFMGDLNTTPEDTVLDPIRAKLYDAAAATPDLFTYPADAPGTRIDYIFLSPNISVSSVYIPSERLSDHLPVVAEISIS